MGIGKLGRCYCSQYHISAGRTVYEKQCFCSAGISEIAVISSACRISVRRTYRNEGKMKSYKEYEKNYIGMSDIANLILAGSSDNGLRLTALHFGMDNDYYAYIVDANAEIGEHYTKVAEFKSWLRIYDDSFLTQEFDANKISVYRAGEMGCIIQLFK